MESFFADAAMHLQRDGIVSVNVQYRRISTGASGAQLYNVYDGGCEYVMKISHPSMMSDAMRMETYKKELNFYKLNQKLKLSFVPHAAYLYESGDGMVMVLMKKYDEITPGEWNAGLIAQAADVCARLGSIEASAFSALGLPVNKCTLDYDLLNSGFSDWERLLRKHDKHDDISKLENVYSGIEAACNILNTPPLLICHGDFHPENILACDGKLVVCDWQSINIGKSAGDISFFISRAKGFGININDMQFMEMYCRKLTEYTGTPFKLETLLREMHASNVITTLSFWAHYLQDAPRGRVEAIFGGMTDGFDHIAAAR